MGQVERERQCSRRKAYTSGWLWYQPGLENKSVRAPTPSLKVIKVHKLPHFLKMKFLLIEKSKVIVSETPGNNLTPGQPCVTCHLVPKKVTEAREKEAPKGKEERCVCVCVCIQVYVYSQQEMKTLSLEEVLVHPFVPLKTNYGWGQVHPYNPSTQEAEAGQPALHWETLSKTNCSRVLKLLIGNSHHALLPLAWL